MLDLDPPQTDAHLGDDRVYNDHQVCADDNELIFFEVLVVYKLVSRWRRPKLPFLMALGISGVQMKPRM